MLALLDGDILVYRIGFTTEDVDLEVAKWRMRELIEFIIEETESDAYSIYLTTSGDPDAFRKKVYPEYKANRRGKPKPLHYHDLRKYLIDEWNAEMVSGIEADDALGMAQTPNTVICSIDKDLKQIEGLHYDFVKDETVFIDEETGLRNFYTQLIVGDSTDNLKGVPGKGAVAAKKLLKDLHLEQDMFDAVRDLYEHDEAMLLTGRCAWIWRKDNDDWLHHFNRLKGTNEGETESRQSSESVGGN